MRRRRPVTTVIELPSRRRILHGVAVLFSAGVYHAGGGVSVPKLQSSIQPEYTAEGRAARIQGTVELLAVIGEDGTPRDMQIQKALGYGLDEKAIQCAAQWRFTPGVYQGSPVPVAASIHVNFRLETPDHYSSGGVIATFEFY
jgi:TonB family protein